MENFNLDIIKSFETVTSQNKGYFCKTFNKNVRVEWAQNQTFTGNRRKMRK